MSERTIKIQALTRVEGEGGLHLETLGDSVQSCRLEIYEPPRLFEALLVGRPLEDVPDVTARICGICPVAYQMSSVHALERALGVEVPAAIRQLRRLLYCGEWIESHALHVYLLNGPDFLGYDGGLEMARDYPEEVRRGLRMKKHGNQLLEILGGRAIHPINVTVGGFYRSPDPAALKRLIPDFQWCLEAAVATTRWAAGFDFPELDTAACLVSVSHPDEYPMNEGQVVTSQGLQIGTDRFEDHFQERHVAHSTALQCLHGEPGQPYLVGPLARVALNADRLSPTARRLHDELAIDWRRANPYQSIVARGLELVHAFEEALAILRDYEPPAVSRVSYDYRAGEGTAATEAPRGLLYHRYRVSETGQVELARIVPPTSQNQAQIERDLKQRVEQLFESANRRPDASDRPSHPGASPLVPSSAGAGGAGPSPPVDDDRWLGRQCENLVRCYDPCISCSTHFLRVHVDRRPATSS